MRDYSVSKEMIRNNKIEYKNEYTSRRNRLKHFSNANKSFSD